MHKNGVGNNSDHVGRYFMDHIHIKASKLIPSDKFPRLYDYQVLRKHQINANISLSDDFIRRNKMLQYYCRFMSVYATFSELSSLWNIKDNINEPYSPGLFHDVKNVISSFSNIADYTIHKYGLYTPLPEYYLLDQRLEQAPNRNSRVIISDRKDALGVPIADLHWELNEHDYRSFRIGQDKIVQELSAIGAGRFIIEEITPELVNERVEGHYHHIGTTRMSTNATDGVVDADSKVHGVENLYIAGSSVFPTAGYSGPTMMILALAYRLAEHLDKKLSPRIP